MKKGKINNSGSYTFTMLRRYGEFWNKDVEDGYYTKDPETYKYQ